jgi:hypothetical protein
MSPRYEGKHIDALRMPLPDVVRMETQAAELPPLTTP